jgi:hypothetical protein
LRVSRTSEAVTSVTPHSRMHVGAGPERRRAKREQPAHECGQFRPAALMTTLRVTAMMRSCSQNSFSSVIIVLSLPTRTCPERLQSAAHPTSHQHLSALDWRFSGTRKRLGFFLGNQSGYASLQGHCLLAEDTLQAPAFNVDLGRGKQLLSMVR